VRAISEWLTALKASVSVETSAVKALRMLGGSSGVVCFFVAFPGFVK
jgi:hypothetical protein